jgi:peptidoglycan-N-acetylglucosamine deacetylase
MKTENPIASLSLDLDNKWSYLKTHGDSGWESFPSYLDVVVPRVLDFLKTRHLTITFFIVGQDAALDKHRELLQAIASAGHEIGNHSFRHEPWLHLYSKEEIKTELAMAEEHIERATGYKPVGFRGPGYSLSHTLLDELIRRGYQYDASTLPNLLAPLARAYYFTTARFTAEQRHQRKSPGWTLRDAFRPITPYRWQTGGGTFIELPVTTLPVFRVPIHMSYLLCLSMLSPTLAVQYYNTALRLCRLTGVQPSWLLHPTDFLGCDDTQDLSFFPAMKLPSEKKLELVSCLLQRLCGQFTVLTLRRHAYKAIEASILPVVEPNFHQISNNSI